MHGAARSVDEDEEADAEVGLAGDYHSVDDGVADEAGDGEAEVAKGSDHGVVVVEVVTGIDVEARSGLR